MGHSIIRLGAIALAIFGAYVTISGPALQETTDLQQTFIGIAQSTSAPADYEDVRGLVSEAVDAALGTGGFANLLSATNEVFIKINGNYGAVPGSTPTGYLTDPRVVRAVAELAAEIVPAAQIKVGEGISHVGTPDLVEFAWGGYDVDLDGYLDGVPGVEMVCLNEPHDDILGSATTYVTYFDDAPGHQNTTWYIPNVIAQADVRISIPVLKTHDIAGLTAAMKNSVGHLPADIYYVGAYSRFNEVRAAIHMPPYPGGPSAAIADINAVVPYQFVVVDALTALREGPWNPDPDLIEPYAIVAGRDAVAVDTALAALIGWDSTSIDYLIYGQNDGTGICDPGYICVRGPSINDVRTDLSLRFPGKIPFPIGYGMGTNGTSGSTAADTNSPWVTITSPVPEDELTGYLTIEFDSGDNEGVVKAELHVDGEIMAHLPYPSAADSFYWHVSSAGGGEHTLQVVVYDFAFNEAADSMGINVLASAAFYEYYE